MTTEEADPITKHRGVNAPWYEGWTLTDEERDVFRQRSLTSSAAKARARSGDGPTPVHPVYAPRLDVETLMPKRKANGLRCLSLFSGGGGLDLGFERAGFGHVASYEILEIAAKTLKLNRPKWAVFGGADGDVRKVDWRQYRGQVDLVHGGPPCQPFSSAGRQRGHLDERDMWPEFVRTILECEPAVFVGENVPALASAKFAGYVEQVILAPLSAAYHIRMFEVTAESVGLPQVRRRVFFVGFKSQAAFKRYAPVEGRFAPLAADDRQPTLFAMEPERPKCPGARWALGLPDIGVDGLVPTLRSGFTGPRHTTSVLSSVSALRIWHELQIWPNGVAPTREDASVFVAKDGHFRLSIPDCALLQGFPPAWKIDGAVYAALGQIGNSVAPPVGYAVAATVADALA